MWISQRLLLIYSPWTECYSYFRNKNVEITKLLKFCYKHARNKKKTIPFQ